MIAMNFKQLCSFAAAAGLLFTTACSPDDHDLATPDVTSGDLVQGIAYKVDVDQTTNTIKLSHNLPASYTAQWIHPNGVSKENTVEIQLPFAGDYEVKLGVMTRGGMVYGEPYVFTLDNTNGELLTDELWVCLTGGVGNSKTWTLDFDSEQKSKYFAGPSFFKGTDDNWNTITLGQEAPEGADVWAWDADWASVGSWIGFDAGVFPDLTFDLIDGAHVTTADGSTGAFVMDTKNHSISLPKTLKWFDQSAGEFTEDWYNVTLLSLTEYYMQIGIIRKADPCMITFNYIADGWDGVIPSDAPTENAPVEPPYEGDLNDDMTTTVTTTKNYTLNVDTPYTWYWWNGAKAKWEDNGFISTDSYGANWCPAVSETWTDDFKLALSKSEADKGTYTLKTPDGEFVGGYTVSDNDIIFDKSLTFLNAGVVNITTDKLTAVKRDTEKKQMWFGIPTKYSTSGSATEYLCIELNEVVVSGEEKNGTYVAVDNSKIVFGDIEGNQKLRIEIFNAYGSTVNNPPLAVNQINYKKSIKVTFTVSGLGTLSEPTTAWLMNSAGNVWNATDEGSVPVSFTGDGTYTVETKGKGIADAGSFVFNVDIENVANLTDVDINWLNPGSCPNIQVTVDSIWLDKQD